MNSEGKIFMNPAKIIRSGENSFMFLIRVCTCSDEINGDSQFISIAREGTAKESAIFKIVAPLFSEKTAFISAFPSWLLLHASRIARAFVPFPEPNITQFTVVYKSTIFNLSNHRR